MKNECLGLLQQNIASLQAEGRYEETIEACNELLQRGKELNDYKSVLTAHINHATSYYCIGDIKEAFSSIEAHEDLCNKYGDEEDILNSFNVMFLLYDYNNDFVNAKVVLEKVIKLGGKLNKFNIVSNAYSNYSHICIAEKNYVEAIEKAEMGLEMAKLHEPATPILELRAKLKLAKAYIQLEKFDSSKYLIEEMMKDPVLDLFLREKAQCQDLHGRWYMKKKKYREAFKSFTIAKELVESYNDVHSLKIIQEKRSELCELMNDIPLGYTVQKEYITLLQEISFRETSIIALKLDVKHKLASIEKKANTDYLSGLYNRQYIENTTNEWLKEASSIKQSIICIVFDIDNFKAINDEYGHLFGDEVIIQVSKACSNIIRKKDLIGRFGGDEFVIILKGISLEDGVRKAKQLLEVIGNSRIEKAGKTVSITASMGITDNVGFSIMDFKELFNLADIKLFEAKRKGKNQICVVN